jgi:glycosyltransferase involved in cell wall biosynthesis
LLISILHPTRSRPQKSIDVTKKWISTAGVDYELIVSIDDNDPYREEYIRRYSEYDYFRTKLISNPNRSAVDAINNAAKESKGDILIVVSDDSDCPDNWGKIIQKATEGKTDFVLKVYDGVQKWLITMPIMDRVYYNRFQYIYFPDYTHMFCDTEFSHVANVLGRVIERNDLLFPHLHYSVTKTGKDSVAIRNDNTWNEGKTLYLRRFYKNFDLTHVNIWDINSDAHSNWLRHSLRTL